MHSRILLLAALTGCSSYSMSKDDGSYESTSGADTSAPALGVGQGGAQDFGYFRDILESGGIPGPETIDDVGFFNEHKIDLPPADCGDDVCAHGRLGLMGNMINGGDCTVVALGLNTPITADELERPPLNLGLAIDVSGSMDGSSLDYVKSGIRLMLAELEPGDEVSLVTFSNTASVVAQGGYDDIDDLVDAVHAMNANGGTNIHQALELAYQTVAETAHEGLQNRVLLLSDGVATSGITSADSIVEVARDAEEFGYTLTTVGLGDEFDITLMEDLALAGSGSFYYVEDPQAVEEVFVEEAISFLVPLAHDAVIEIEVEPGWSLRDVYGTDNFIVTDGRAIIDIDTLQIAGRTSASDQESGRRGGGGAIIAELVPEDGTPSGQVGVIDFSYSQASDGEQIANIATISSPLDPRQLENGESYFEDEAVAKAFVMLNIYVGFELAATDAAQGNFDNALATLRALCGSVEAWLVEHPDEDIADDLRYIDMFIENLETAGAEQGEEADPWPSD